MRNISILSQVKAILYEPRSAECIVLIVTIALILIGFYIICEKEIKNLSNRLKAEKKRKVVSSPTAKFKRKIDKYLSSLIEANNLSTAFTAKHLQLLCLCIFGVMLFLSLPVLFPTAAIVDSLVIAVLPIVVLRVNLERKRTVLSHDAEVMINEFIVKYRIQCGNVEDALEGLLSVRRLKNSKKTIARLLLKLRNARFDSDIREATNMFAFSIGTNWSNVLASNIYHAKVYGVNITASLEELLLQSREGRHLWETQKRSTAEPRRMLWGIPVLYVVLAIFSVGSGDISVKEYIYNQFFTSQGISLFSLIIIGSVISIVYAILLFSRKFDF